MNADGADAQNLTNHDAEDIQPDWSPDSQKIAFVSDRAEGDDIFVIGADGKNLKRLTNVPQPDTEPAWSPDGEKIVFTSARGGKVDIWVMDANGKGEPEKLTDEANWNRSADWFDPAFAQRFPVSPANKRPLTWGWLKRSGHALSQR
jgi:TolB protein